MSAVTGILPHHTATRTHEQANMPATPRSLQGYVAHKKRPPLRPTVAVCLDAPPFDPTVAVCPTVVVGDGCFLMSEAALYTTHDPTPHDRASANRNSVCRVCKRRIFFTKPAGRAGHLFRTNLQGYLAHKKTPSPASAHLPPSCSSGTGRGWLPHGTARLLDI